MKTVHYDLYRLTGRTDVCTFIKKLSRDVPFRYIVHFSLRQKSKRISLSCYISFNSHAKADDNSTIIKGATIGIIKSFKQQGEPIVGNAMYACLNPTVVAG